MSSAAQGTLISQTEEVIRIARLLKNLHRLIQETGTTSFCKAGPGRVGCGREIHFIKLKDGRIRCVDDEGGTHVCPEVRP